jgi:GNAT superfamily N-acetyltransferase
MNSAIERRLKVIEKATPTLKGRDSDSIKIILHEGNIVSGEIKRTAQGYSVFLEELRVLPENLRGHGIGGRLLRTFFRHCSDIGAEYVDSVLLSVPALRNRDRIFGETALHFIAKTDNGEVELPLSIEQACASLDRTDKIWESATEEELMTLDPGILVRVYLSDVDTSTWEAPVPSEW